MASCRSVTACLCALIGFAAVLFTPVAARAQNGLAPASDYQRALTCLTQAISYEAANEPLAGQEAVAQVILNRMRHPAYPSTVCGVVYQGSERKTGCQFTFTCDGSLSRGRSATSLARARVVAEQVLAGRASAIVGGATHYHANYVSPYWAPSLVKVATIGAHLFYRMPGAPDSPATVSPTSLRNEPAVADSLILGPPQPSQNVQAPLPSGIAYSPWGLPVLVIARDGSIQQKRR